MGDHLNVTRCVRWILFGVFVILPATTLAQSPTRGLRAERFNVTLTLLADGSVDVRETVVFHFSEKTFSKVEREIPIRRLDGVIDVRASLDGRLLTEDGSERVRIRQGRRTLRVTWTFPKTIDQSRTFTLEYRAMGALAMANGRATMDWIVLPSRHRYLIDEARVEWRVPPAVVRVDPTTLDDSRWTSLAMPDGWAATRRGVGVDETARLMDAFDASTMAATVPQWQTNADRAWQMAPSFLIGALTLLVMAAGVVGMTWFRYHQPARESRVVEPARVDALPPALGTALVRGAVGVGPAQMQATLLDLARRGIVEIREVPDDQKRFELVMPPTPRVRPHEQVLTDGLWLQMKNGRADLATAWRHLVRTLPVFRQRVLAELQESGLIDAERRAAARGLTISGLVVTLLGMAGVVITALLFGHLGDIPLLVPGAVVISGIGFVIAGQAMSLLSVAGQSAAEEWRARRHWIKSALKSSISGGDVEQWFPVAAGFGLAGPMLKAGNHPSAALAAIVATTPTTTHHGGVG